ncbi:MAG: isocitrate/isopropylmalate family dehydrogenase [Bacteroidia bacterium]
MSEKQIIAVANGDGIGPEIMKAVINIFEAAQVPLHYEYVDMGKSIFDKGYGAGMTEDARATIEKLGVLFKGPMETPKGKGVKSINVTARKLWNTYANVRKFKTLEGVNTVFSKAGIPIDITIVRENIEDTYGGIEYLPAYDMALGLRLVSRGGSEQFMRFVFETARRQGTDHVTCAHKANIMKLTDGMFLNTFYEIAKEYPDIKTDDVIIDDLCMKLVRWPDRFKMIAATNLQGDIISDLCAGLVGGLGFAPGANIGDNISIFEAVHGTAPDIAGKNIANPTSLLLSGLYMLRFLGLAAQADQVENSLYYTLEQGIHTGDFGEPGSASENTEGFAQAIINNLGSKPERTEPVHTVKTNKKMFSAPRLPEKQIVLQTSRNPQAQVRGIDIGCETQQQPEEIANVVLKELPPKFKLTFVSNRGTIVWPTASKFTELVGYARLRIEVKDENVQTTEKELLELSVRLSEKIVIGHVFILKYFDGERGFSLAQGQ